MEALAPRSKTPSSRSPSPLPPPTEADAVAIGVPTSVLDLPPPSQRGVDDLRYTAATTHVDDFQSEVQLQRARASPSPVPLVPRSAGNSRPASRSQSRNGRPSTAMAIVGVRSSSKSRGEKVVKEKRSLYNLAMKRGTPTPSPMHSTVDLPGDLLDERTPLLHRERAAAAATKEKVEEEPDWAAADPIYHLLFQAGGLAALWRHAKTLEAAEKKALRDRLTDWGYVHHMAQARELQVRDELINANLEASGFI